MTRTGLSIIAALLIAAWAIVCLAGCTTLTYTTPDGSRAHYATIFTDRKLHDPEVILPGLTLRAASSSSEQDGAEAIASLGAMLGEMFKRAWRPGP